MWKTKIRQTIILGAVLYVTTVVFCDLSGGERIIAYFSLHRVVFSPSISKGLQESAASRARTS
jgi:hypothetical protein